MQIDSFMPMNRTLAGVPPAGGVVPLEQQFGGAAPQSAPDPEFDRFYGQFIKWVNGADELSGDIIRRYLSCYTDAEGGRPYQTTQELAALILKLMGAMKAERLDQTPEYKEVTNAYGLVFSADLFIKSSMAEIFRPSDDEDSRENIDW
ncbi:MULTISPECIES: hypothetical protein [Pseudomonas]|jgi:hypothetical protein|uniref:hypothetical protein n=1 Tax=Pseudomonas TaxID=286 RepID=UPI00099BCDE1|nr:MULTISPECIES: hypothetical protein [Pseudomonas]MCK3838833.1 hypothetical protein [Pseudomonas sp. NCIMB 10586]OPA97786.1 hypothetical protein BFW89_27410 [Pseudomonas synxantha]VCU67898.1 Hypothetical new protein [Pseudomonas synxantha]